MNKVVCYIPENCEEAEKSKALKTLKKLEKSGFSVSVVSNFDDLLKFGSNLNTNQLVLVHGSTEAKNCLKEHLREEISKNDKCYKVKCSEKDMIISL